MHPDLNKVVLLAVCLAAAYAVVKTPAHRLPHIGQLAARALM